MADLGAARARPPVFRRDGTMLEPAASALALVWRAVRALSKRSSFDVPQVAMIAGISSAYAKENVSRLARAGYLRLVTPHQNWRGQPGTYRMVRDTGPVAPRIDVRPGRRVLIDGNTGERIDIASRQSNVCEPDRLGGVG